MRTLIQGGWVVGYDGKGHELIPNGTVVFEDDRIVHVGRSYPGPVDRRLDAAGKLVSPGFINCHLHAATNATQSVFLDGLKTDYFGSTALGFFIRLHKMIKDHGGRMVLCNMSAHETEILEVTKLSDYWTIQPTREAALKSIKG